MNLFLREMKANRRSLLLWCMGMALLIGASMGKYAGMAEQIDSMRELIALYPKALLALFGIGTFDIATPEGFFGVIHSLALFVAGLHAALLGVDLMAKEERDRTAEFLLSKPIPRWKVLAYKAMAGLACVAVLCATTWLVCAATTAPYIENDASFLAPLMLGMLALQIVFLCVGLMLGAIVNKHRAGLVASLIVMATYMIDKCADFLGGMDALEYFTPFGFLGADRMIVNGGYGALAVALAIALIVGSSAVAAWAYPRRDVRV